MNIEEERGGKADPIDEHFVVIVLLKDADIQIIG
jgi:hypothetical protein